MLHRFELPRRGREENELVKTPLGVRAGAVMFPGLAKAQMTHVGGEYYRDASHIYIRVKTRGDVLFSGPVSYTFEQVVGADPGSFVALEDGYAKDKNYVYNGQRLDNVDVRTFEPIGKGFYRDKHNVRHGAVLQLRRSSPGSKPVSFDPSSFDRLGCGFVRDKTGIYIDKALGDEISEHNKYHKYDLTVTVLDRIDIVDAKTFEVVSQRFSGCEAKDRYFLYHTTSLGQVPHRVDIVGTLGNEKYQRLGGDFIATDRGVFWVDRAIDFADVKTFEVLAKTSGKECSSAAYAKDRGHVYYQNRVIEDADPETFQMLDGVRSCIYAFDKSNRYSQGINIKKFADPNREIKNFEKVYEEWKKSRQGVQ